MNLEINAIKICLTLQLAVSDTLYYRNYSISANRVVSGTLAKITRAVIELAKSTVAQRNIVSICIMSQITITSDLLNDRRIDDVFIV